MLLAAFVPIVTLAVVGDDVRSLFDGRYVVDDFSLILKALFLLAAYVVVLISQTELEEGGYYQGEYYVLLLCSVLGMVMMASSRDLVSVFIALELLSIPAYMLAAWRKRDTKSQRGRRQVLPARRVRQRGAAVRHEPAVRGDRLHAAHRHRRRARRRRPRRPDGRRRSCSSSPGSRSRCRPCRSTRGRPTRTRARRRPVTAFLSVASKAAGFVALILVIFLAFPTADDVYGPFVWVLSALTMTVGNVLALRQTNIVRMLAYSSVSQGGFILMPLAYVNTGDAARVRPEGRRRLPARLRASRTSAPSPSSSPSAARPTAGRSPRSAGSSSTPPAWP